MTIRAMTMAGVLAAALLLPAAAEAAWIGFATTTVNLRASPGGVRITVVPAGARLRVLNCFNWCRVRYGGLPGWVAARYIVGGMGPGRSHYFIANQPPLWGPYYRNPWRYRNPFWYGYGYPQPGFSLWLGFGG